MARLSLNVSRMLYFFILPAYLLLLLVVSITSTVLYFRPSSRHVGRYGIGIAVGSLPGFLVANVVLWIFTIAILDLQLPDWLQGIHKLIVGVLVFLGPVPVSALGIIAGGLIGAYITHRMSPRLTNRCS